MIKKKIKKWFPSLYKWLNKHYIRVKNRRKYNQDWRHFIIQYSHFTRHEDLPIKAKDKILISDEDTQKTRFDHHYVYHTAWAARMLAKLNPEKHYDIGSHHYFATLVSAFIPINFYDYRPIEINLSNLISDHEDLTHLSFTDNSIPSISCMHVVEHIGLGRYGDAIDPNGDIKAMDELSRVVAHEGYLLFVVPIGKSRICFNAHRIYNPSWIKSFFVTKGFKLRDFSVITDTGVFLEHKDPVRYQDQNYACGCYLLHKTTSKKAMP